MTNLTHASREFLSRQPEERFTSLWALDAFCQHEREITSRKVLPNRGLEVMPDPQDPEKGLQVVGKAGVPYFPNHWAFGQLAARAGAPAGYLRELPSPLAADCLNYGLRFTRDVEDLSVFLRKPEAELPSGSMLAVNGPAYGMIRNASITKTLVQHFGDGLSGDWRVPGEFGKALDQVTKANTTLFCGPESMFVFLADETNRITIPNRRNGSSGTLARGFTISNSEVGAAKLIFTGFLFDYACCNRIIWGAEQVREISIRHTGGAPHRMIEEVLPVLADFRSGSAESVVQAIANAQAKRISGDVTEWLSKRYGKAIATGASLAHLEDEGRPIETLWDATTGLTAYARSIPYQLDRVAVERDAGKLLTLAQ